MKRKEIKKENDTTIIEKQKSGEKEHLSKEEK